MACHQRTTLTILQTDGITLKFLQLSNLRIIITPLRRVFSLYTCLSRVARVTSLLTQRRRRNAAIRISEVWCHFFRQPVD